MRRLLSFILLVLIASSIVFANGAQEATATTAPSKDFVYVTGSEPVTFDPHLVTDANTSKFMTEVHETLYMRDEKANIIPLLAESSTTSEDGLTWVIKLKEGIKFTDGTDFNAEAVKYSFDRLRSKEISSPKASALNGINEVIVKSPYEVEFHLASKNLVFLATLTNYSTAIMSPTAGQKYGKEKYGENPVGTGPLMLKEWNHGSSLVLTKNPNYWGKEPTVDNVTVKVVPEDASRVMMIKSGDADIIAGVQPIQADDLKSDKNVEMIVRPGYRTIFIGMNNDIKPFDNPKVRMAVCYAINKKAIIDNILKGIATYPSGFMSSVIQYSALDLDPHEIDQAKSKQLLAEAGYPDGFKSVLYTCEGRYTMDRQVSEVVQSMLAEVGIQVEVKVLEWGSYLNTVKKGECPMFLLGKGCSTGDPEFDMLMHVISNGGQNYYHYSNPEVDELLHKVANADNLEQRADYLHQIQVIHSNDVPLATLYYEAQTFAVRKGVSGMLIYPNETLDLAWMTRE